MPWDLDRLTALASYDILDTPPEPSFDIIVELAKEVCQTPIALVSLVAEDRQWFKARTGLELAETPLNQSVCAHAVAAGSTLIIDDLSRDERTRENPLVTGQPQIRFYAGAPLITVEKHVLGTVCVIDTVPRPGGLSATQKTSLELLARQAVIQIELRRGLTLRDEVIAEERREGTAAKTRALLSEVARENLRIREERSRMAQEAGAIGTFDVDISTAEVDVSDEFCRIFGLPENARYAASLLEGLVVPEDRGAASSSESRRDRSATMQVEYRVRRADSGRVRWILRQGRFWPEAGVPERMYGTVQDITDRKESERRVSALLKLGDELRSTSDAGSAVRLAAETLGLTLDGLRAGYVFIDPKRSRLAVRHDWSAEGAAPAAGEYPLETFAAILRRLEGGEPLVLHNLDDLSALGADLPSYDRMGTRALIKVPIIKAGSVEGFVFIHSGVPRVWTKAEVDFTEAVADRTYAAITQIEAQDRQRVLNHELSHRLKNTLSMVSGIASQTIREASDRLAVKAFNDRIQALSKAHDILMQESWASARIRPVVEAELALHAPEGRYEISGPDLSLLPGAALSLSLLLHELATNALKYGALSVPTGRVHFSWSITQLNPAALILRWEERDGPAVVEPTRRGFGSRLIASGIAPDTDVDLRFESGGLTAQFTCPLNFVGEL